MKRVCSFVAVLLLIIAAGCQKQEDNKTKSAPIPSVYSAKLDVTFGEIKMTAKLTKHSAEKYEIQMLTPEIMQPLNLIYENGTCTVTYDGLTFETDLKRFPQAEFGALLTHALSDASGNVAITTEYSDKAAIYKGVSDYGDFILIQDYETGLWKEFKIEGASLHIVFSDYEY